MQQRHNPTHEHAQEIEKPQRPNIPDKLFYKIGEVSRIASVEPYVLRYWESEFPFLKPRKSKTGQRVYIRKDLETILEIKQLLYDERYTIEGVRKKLAENGKLIEPQKGNLELPLGEIPVKTRPRAEEMLAHVKSKLRSLLDRLS